MVGGIDVPRVNMSDGHAIGGIDVPSVSMLAGHNLGDVVGGIDVGRGFHLAKGCRSSLYVDISSI